MSPDAGVAPAGAHELPVVADLLAQSRAAHAKYRTLAGRVDSKGAISQAPNLYDAGQAIQVALSARLEAERLDPNHTDPAWAADERLNKGATSASLIEFYARWLSPRESAA
jgi:hypothetical protein